MPPVRVLIQSSFPLYTFKTNHGIIERETHTIVRKDAVIFLHSSDCHLRSHSKPPCPHPSVAREEAHQIQRSLIGAAEWTTYLQICVVCAVTLLTDIEGERWSSEEKQ